MTAAQIIAAARVPGTMIMVLGCFERRVTVFSQQVRALNLVDALVSQNLVRDDGKVAIVGAGIAGITAAIALSYAKPGLQKLDVFEKRSAALELQRNSGRYLHPHLYDWPAGGATDPNANLPLLNWGAGDAREIGAALWTAFDARVGESRLHLYDETPVNGLEPGGATVRVRVPGSTNGRIYDLVILSVGFGIERELDAQTKSYWSASDLAGPLITAVNEPLIFISGNGDGGLVDFQMAALNGLEHRAICEFFIGLDLGAATSEIQTIEAEAWAVGANVDLLAAYRARVKRHISPQVSQLVVDRLRPNCRVMFHTREAVLLRKTTALHNRIATFLILEADADSGNGRIQVVTNAEFVDDPPPKVGPITINGHAPFEPYMRIFRMGADADSNLKPFDKVLATFPGRTNTPASELRPESPELSLSARDRFAAFAPAAPAAEEAAAVVIAAVEQRRVKLGTDAAGVAWTGDVPPNEANLLWQGNERIDLFIDIPAADSGSLLFAIARLTAHAAGARIHVKDTAGWREAIRAICAAKNLPAPDLAPNCFVQDWVDPPALANHAASTIDDLASDIQGRLDAETLRQLHSELHDILGPAALDIGWPIEPGLSALLWVRWQEWHQILLADAVINRRFLLLLASPNDAEDIVDAALVAVGPRSLRHYLTKPAIFGLAFSLSLGEQVTPAATSPGNIAGDGLTGHACGVSWIAGRDIGPKCVAGHGWTSGVVLLAQLRDAFYAVNAETRFDRDDREAGKVGIVARAESPLVIGADDNFIDALAAGHDSVREYLRAIFDWRANNAQAMLESNHHG